MNFKNKLGYFFIFFPHRRNISTEQSFQWIAIEYLVMNRLLVSWVTCLVALMAVASALEPSEVETLRTILETFPALLRVNPIERYTYNMPVDYDWGGDWTPDMSETCTGGSGWQRHGIFCNSEGHISEIRLYAL